MAHILTAKLADASPFYRQEQQFIRQGAHMPQATMCFERGRTLEHTGFHAAKRSEIQVKRLVGRLLGIEAALIAKPSFDITLPQSEPQYPLPQFLP